MNILDKFCDKWGMKVNLTRTQVIVFRNDGKTSKSETNLIESKLLHTTAIWG